MSTSSFEANSFQLVPQSSRFSFWQSSPSCQSLLAACPISRPCGSPSPGQHHQRAIRNSRWKLAPHSPPAFFTPPFPYRYSSTSRNIKYIPAQSIPLQSRQRPPASNLLIIWRCKAPAPAKSPRSNGHSLLPNANISILSLVEVESLDLLH
jgi:hypothetical protein